MMNEYGATRLRDLSDKESSELLKRAFEALENANGSADFGAIAEELEITPLLLDDVIEVMILKGWLEVNESTA